MSATPSRLPVSAKAPRHPLLRKLLARPSAAVMGVLNVTPDSFSDGGQFYAPGPAIRHAQRLVSDGADIIDVGAESTRPYGGASPVSEDEEIRRLKPILREVVKLGVPVSIDSMKAKVVAFALEAGSAIANDVWGLQRDPEMAAVVAAHDIPVIVMHNRDAADPAIDIMKDIADFFARSLDIAAKAGIAAGNIVLDPGIGFGKTAEQSMIALARLEQLKAFGLPILVGAAEAEERLGGSIAAHLIAVQRGAAIIRAHDVAETVQALRLAAAIEEKR